MDSPKYCLILLGSPGTNKTYFCASIVDWALSRFNSVRYFKESDLWSKVKQSFENRNSSQEEELRHLIDHELIILDDVGCSRDDNGQWKKTPWQKDMFFDFIDQRYHSTLPTIITSNLNKNEFRQIYEEKVTSRLFSKDNTILELFGEDLRQ